MSEVIEKTVTNEEMTTETNDKLYTLRELYDEDLYTVLEIIGAVLPDELKDSFSDIIKGVKGSNKEDVAEKTGGAIAFEIVKLILKNFRTVKDEVYAFLSDLSGIPADDIRKMPFGTTPKMLKEVFTNPKNASFFKELSKLF